MYRYYQERLYNQSENQFRLISVSGDRGTTYATMWHCFSSRNLIVRLVVPVLLDPLRLSVAFKMWSINDNQMCHLLTTWQLTRRRGDTATHGDTASEQVDPPLLIHGGPIITRINDMPGMANASVWVRAVFDSYFFGLTRLWLSSALYFSWLARLRHNSNSKFANLTQLRLNSFDPEFSQIWLTSHDILTNSLL